MNKRNFLIKGIKAIAAMLGTGSIQAKTQEPPSENTRVKMLTQDGKLVWVDMKDCKRSSKHPISNKELYSWINPDKHGTE